LISILLLALSGALAVGVFLYSQYLQASVQSKLQQLNRAEASFDPSLVQQLTRLDTRMNTAEDLLKAHLAPTRFFATLEASTVQDISFGSLSYTTTDPQDIDIKMDGVAGSINAIALQAQVFSQGGVIASPIFANIDREADGVHFTFTGTLNASEMTYEGLVSGQSSVEAQPQTPVATTSAPATPASVFESTTTTAQSPAAPAQ
jgi:hypothetical protein